MKKKFSYVLVFKTEKGLKSYSTREYSDAADAWAAFREICSFLAALDLCLEIVDYKLYEI